MNGVSLLVFLAVMALGGIFCFLAAIFIMEGLRRINPAWVGAVPPPLPPAPKKKTRLIPRRKIPDHLLKLAAKAGAAACLGYILLLGTGPRELTQLDGIRTNFWPVWARPGNDNIISRIKYFGQEFSQNRTGKIESVPEELWPFWMRQGNEHLLKRRSPWCGGTV